MKAIIQQKYQTIVDLATELGLSIVQSAFRKGSVIINHQGTATAIFGEEEDVAKLLAVYPLEE